MNIEPTTFRRLLVSSLALVALFYSLGGRGLNEPDEGRFAEIGREMAVTGDWLTPRLNGVPHLPKPPLTYWMIAASIKAFGPTEFAARLPAALAALMTLLGLYLLTRSALGEEAGLLSVLVLLSSPLFFVIARLITTDMLMTCFVTWSVWALWRWHESGNRNWRKLQWFYVFLGLGMMTKGPVAVVLSLMALAGLRWGNSGRSFGRMYLGRGLLVVLLIAAPWFVAVAGTNTEIWKYFIGREMVGRVVSSVHRRGEAWWFFVPVVAGGMLFWLPWLMAAPVVLRGSSDRQTSIIRLCLAWAGLGLILFSVSRSKLATYVLPLMPPMALLTAATLVGFNQRLAARRQVGWVVAAGSGSLVMLCVVVVSLAAISVRRLHMAAVAWIPAGLLTLSILVTATWLLTLRKLLPASAALGFGITGLLMHLADNFSTVENQISNSAPLNVLARRIVAEDPAGQSPVVAYQILPPGLLFYLGRLVLWYHASKPDRVAQDQGVFEYRSPQTETPTVMTNVARLTALLKGPDRVFCVVRSGDANEIAGQFALQELTRNGRYALLSNPNPSPGENSRPKSVTASAPSAAP